MIFYSFIEISIIYIENMVLFEVNKLKKYPQNKKTPQMERQNFIKDSDITFIVLCANICPQLQD